VKYGVNVILAVEICFYENRNDYLVYGVEENEIDKMIKLVPHGIERFYKEIKNDRNVILQAHPFRKGMVLAPLGSIDGIESFNLHSSHNSKIGMAARYARENGLLVTGGSDFHHKEHEAVIFARSKEKLCNSFDVAKLIKSKDYLFDISGSIIFPYADV
jgi:predicted metal-dependent phosphoesterase TrpH